MEPPEYRDRYLDVGDQTIRYWDEGNGPVVLFVHGLAASVEFWQYNVGALASRYRVVALDLLGFGRSDKKIEEFSLAYAARFMLEFLNALDIQHASLVGNSLGGLVCLQTAVSCPLRVGRLVLVDPAGFGRELNPLLRLWSIPAVGKAVFWLYQLLFARLRPWVFPGSHSISRGWLARTAEVLRTPGVRENAIKVARAGVTLYGQREELFCDLHEQLGAMTVPTLIIWGDRDPVVPLKHAYIARSLIPNSEVRIMAGCGHLPQLERPEEFNRLALDFLDSGPRAGPTIE
jgi:pimeloyl-ACP methyl ester carboxylesterase